MNNKNVYTHIVFGFIHAALLFSVRMIVLPYLTQSSDILYQACAASAAGFCIGVIISKFFRPVSRLRYSRVFGIGSLVYLAALPYILLKLYAIFYTPPFAHRLLSHTLQQSCILIIGFTIPGALIGILLLLFIRRHPCSLQHLALIDGKRTGYYLLGFGFSSILIGGIVSTSIPIFIGYAIPCFLLAGIVLAALLQKKTPPSFSTNNSPFIQSQLPDITIPHRSLIPVIIIVYLSSFAFIVSGVLFLIVFSRLLIMMSFNSPLTMPLTIGTYAAAAVIALLLFSGKFDRNRNQLLMLGMVYVLFGIVAFLISRVLPLLQLILFDAIALDIPFFTAIPFIITFIALFIPLTAFALHGPIFIKLITPDEHTMQRRIETKLIFYSFAVFTGILISTKCIIPLFELRSALLISTVLPIITGMLIFFIDRNTAFVWKGILYISAIVMIIIMILIGPDWRPSLLYSGTQYNAALFRKHYLNLKQYSPSLDYTDFIQRIYGTLIYTRDGAYQSSAVFRRKPYNNTNQPSALTDTIMITHNSIPAGISPTIAHRLTAHIPMLLHSAPLNVLIAEPGTGELTHTVQLYAPHHIDVVLPAAEIQEASTILLADYNENAFSNPAVSIYTQPPQVLLYAAAHYYDVIIIADNHQTCTGFYNNALYIASLKQAISTNGIVCLRLDNRLRTTAGSIQSLQEKYGRFFAYTFIAGRQDKSDWLICCVQHPQWSYSDIWRHALSRQSLMRDLSQCGIDVLAGSPAYAIQHLMQSVSVSSNSERLPFPHMPRKTSPLIAHTAGPNDKLSILNNAQNNAFPQSSIIADTTFTMTDTSAESISNYSSFHAPDQLPGIQTNSALSTIISPFFKYDISPELYTQHKKLIQKFTMTNR